MSGVIPSVYKDLGHEAARRSRLAASLLGVTGPITDPASCHAYCQRRAMPLMTSLLRLP